MIKKLLLTLGLLLAPGYASAQAVSITQCPVTTGAPTYTTGTTRSCSLDTSGQLRVNALVTPSGTQAVSIANGADVTLGAIADAAWTSGSGTAIAILKAISGGITASTIAFNGASNADGVATSTALFPSASNFNYVWNATTWDRQKGDTINGTLVGGNVAHDAVDTGNPVKVGGKAISSETAAVSAGDRANFVSDLTGKQIVLPYANPENFVSGLTAAMTGTTSTSIVAAPASGLRNYLTQIICTNSHASVGTFVIVQDGSGGTTYYEGYAAAVGGGFSITFPTPLRQPSTATAVFVADVTTGANVICAASGYKGI